MLFHKRTLVTTLVGILFIVSATLFYFYPNLRRTANNKTHHVSIVAAHNEKMKELVIPFLQEQYKKKFNATLHVEWIKYGGQNTNVKVINTIFKKNKEVTCGYDIIWGGGGIIFFELQKAKRLVPLHLPTRITKNIPKQLAGAQLYSQTWVATSLSSFGMIYNKVLFKKLKLPIPTSWEDLASTNLFEKVVTVDPCQSNNMWTIYAMILQAYGWEKGWMLLTKIAANSITCLNKSSGAASSIAQGIGLIAPTNDFYAQGTIHMHGKENLGFIIPIKQTIVNIDPIAILKGAPNIKNAEFCIRKIVEAIFQCYLMHNKDTTYGPKKRTMGRIAINKKAYQMANPDDLGSAINPFKMKQKAMKLNNQKATQQYPIVSALFKAYCITPHKQLQKAWLLIIQNGCKPEDIKELATPPLTQEQIQKLAAQWKNPLFKQKCMIQWTNQAMKRYEKIIRKYKT